MKIDVYNLFAILGDHYLYFYDVELTKVGLSNSGYTTPLAELMKTLCDQRKYNNYVY